MSLSRRVSAEAGRDHGKSRRAVRGSTAKGRRAKKGSELRRWIPHVESLEKRIVLSGPQAELDFIKGVNFNGQSVEIEDRRWLSQTEAEADGLTIAPDVSLSSSLLIPAPLVGPDLAHLLRTNIWNVGNLELSQTLPDGRYDVEFWVMENERSHLRRLDIELEGEVAATGGYLPLGGWEKMRAESVLVNDGVLDILVSARLPLPYLAGMAIFKHPNVPPEVSLAAPSLGASFTEGDTISLAAAASDADGTIESVRFLADGELLAEVTSEPYAFDWVDVPSGTYQFVAEVTDNDGEVVASQPVDVVVHAKPIVEITAPVAVVAETDDNPALFRIQRTDATSELVVHYVVGGSADAADFTADLSGSVTLASGQQIADIPVSPTSDTLTELDETVVLTLLADSAYVVGDSHTATVTIQDVSAVDSVFVRGINFNGDAVVVDENEWLGQAEAELHGLSIPQQYYRAATFINPTPAVEMPVGDMLRTNIWTSSDELAFSQSLPAGQYDLEFWIMENWSSNARVLDLEVEGEVVAAEVGRLSFGYWNAYEIREVEITDGALDVVVHSRRLDPHLMGLAIFRSSSAAAVPTVTLTEPSPGSTYTAGSDILLTAAASDLDGTVTKVEFYADSTRLAEVSAAPYEHVWADVQVGTYQLTAHATDNDGNTTISNAVEIVIADPLVPTLSISAVTPLIGEADGDPATFRVSRSVAGDEVTVRYEVSGSASPDDYNGVLDGTVVIPAGETVADIVVTPHDDGQVEGDESLVLTLLADAGYAIENASATVTILDALPGGESFFVKGINFNGNSLVIDGNQWLSQEEAENDGLTLPDNYRSAQTVLRPVPAADLETTHLLQTNIWSRTGELSLSQELPAGSYDVHFWVMENWRSHHRSLDIAIEGELELDAIGSLPFGQWESYEANSIIVSDGALDISILSEGRAEPHVMGIAIYRSSGTNTNFAPTISLATTGSTSVLEGETISLVASAEDFDGTISSVEFLVDGTSLAVDTTAPYEYDWQDVVEGEYDVTARATDDDGLTAETEPLRFLVRKEIPPPTGIEGRQLFVAPDAAGGDGSLENPLSILEVLSADSIVRPGDVVWLREGVYHPEPGAIAFTSYLTGTEEDPVLFASYPGERATFNSGFRVYGAHTTYANLEVTDFDSTHRAVNPGSQRFKESNAFSGFDLRNVGNALINNYIHENAGGIFAARNAGDVFAYGNVIFNNGWVGPDRLHGHGIYTQNSETTTKQYQHNIITRNFGNGFQLYGTSAAILKNVHLQDNVLIRENMITGGSPLENVTVDGTLTYVNRNKTFPQNDFGYGAPEWDSTTFVQHSDVSITNNYLVGGAMLKWMVDGLTFTGNTLIKPAEQAHPLIFMTNQYSKDVTNANDSNPFIIDNNTYFGSHNGHVVEEIQRPNRRGPIHTFDAWQAASGYDANSTWTDGIPVSMEIFARANDYESGRGYVTIYNWEDYLHQPGDPIHNTHAHSVDISHFGLEDGDVIEVRNAEDPLGEPVTMTVRENSQGRILVDLPLTGWGIDKPNEYDQLASNAFIREQFEVRQMLDEPIGPAFNTLLIQKRDISLDDLAGLLALHNSANAAVAQAMPPTSSPPTSSPPTSSPQTGQTPVALTSVETTLNPDEVSATSDELPSLPARPRLASFPLRSEAIDTSITELSEDDLSEEVVLQSLEDAFSLLKDVL